MQTSIIGVGAQSTLGGTTFLPEKYVGLSKINKMPEFYMIHARNIIKIPEFLAYLPEKFYKIPEFRRDFCPKNIFPDS